MLLLLGTAVVEPQDMAASYAPAPAVVRLELGVNRSIDGIDYLGDNGYVAAALQLADDSGWYFASEGLLGRGDGKSYPEVATRALNSSLGFRWFQGRHAVALELQDYRWFQSGDRYSRDRRADFQGMAVNYAYGSWHVELGTERDRPLYYAPLDRFFRYDIDHLALAHRWQLPGDLQLSLAFGHADTSGIPPSHFYLNLLVAGRWSGMDWHLRISHVEAAAADFYPLIDRTSVGFAVSRAFALP